MTEAAAPGAPGRAQVKLEVEDGGGVLRFSGAVDRYHVGALLKRCTDAIGGYPEKSLDLDLDGVAHIDSLGIAMLHRLEEVCRHRGISTHRRNVPERVEGFLSYVEGRSTAHEEIGEAPPRPGPVAALGAWFLEALENAGDFVRFLGFFLVTSAGQLLRPRRMRWREAALQLDLIGASAAPLVVTLSLLLGTIMVFQAMGRIETLGAEIYVADMVVIAVTRELGPLLTAVVLAGRSGSAFAAEIGTMKLNEEIDALTVMDVNVMRYLVLPRVFAIVLAGPILVMLSDAFGIAGGLLSSRIVMGLPPESFLSEVQRTLGATDIYTGLIRGGAFALLIGLVGCFRGLRTRHGPRSIGVQTTSAVVTGVFVVIVADAFFSYVFQLYGW